MPLQSSPTCEILARRRNYFHVVSMPYLSHLSYILIAPAKFLLMQSVLVFWLYSSCDQQIRFIDQTSKANEANIARPRKWRLCGVTGGTNFAVQRIWIYWSEVNCLCSILINLVGYIWAEASSDETICDASILIFSLILLDISSVPVRYRQTSWYSVQTCSRYMGLRIMHWACQKQSAGLLLVLY